MCLAIPGRVKKIFNDHTAEIEIGGIIKRASLDLIPKVEVGYLRLGRVKYIEIY
jgi:hydrogenase maturation factor